MNSFELIPTEENLIQTLNQDLLKREQGFQFVFMI